LEDRRNVGGSSCNAGDGTDQMVQSLMFMMMMMMMMMMMIYIFITNPEINVVPFSTHYTPGTFFSNLLLSNI
jgi:hypothetical protein